MNVVRSCLKISSDSAHTRWICPLLLLADAGLTGLVIWKIPYTEIDWKAYMQQVEQYIAGERDYTKIYGGTGPLVYPASHVYIYQWLYNITDRGHDIRLAQIIFGALYLATLALAMACYRNAKVSPYVFPLLVLSKRMHSIFVLRCFNDCWAVFFLFLAIYCFQKRLWSFGSVVYSIGLGVKMSLLLALPAVGVILLQAVGRNGAIKNAVLIVAVQIITGLPFLTNDAQAYLSRAFEFSRQFFFKWTVNWRFVGEERFLSSAFSRALLVSHVFLLVLFTTTRWLKPSRQSLAESVRSFLSPSSLPPQKQAVISARTTPRFILTTILGAMAIGSLCARSLHYQFYSWIVWTTPYLLWRAGAHPVVQYALFFVQEWAWNVYPSTAASSAAVVVGLGVTVAMLWNGTVREDGSDSSVEHQHVD
ncbi:glycosyltransferase [Delphinella strobiligena]|nr:glycosyltransferase [Delphinella strobiligena]